MSADGILAWLEGTALATAVREGVWLYPAIETVHILALATLFGSIALLDLRILGASRLLPLDALAGHALRPVYAAFPVLVASGSLMFIADATALAENPAFRTKMVLVPLAVLNALAFDVGWFRGLRADPARPVPGVARVFAAASLGLWIAVIVCGRLIAYV
jgi:hypothetical protein